MKDFFKGILYSISYFTIIPVGDKTYNANKAFYKGTLFGLPFSGFILAILISSIYISLSFILPSWYAAILSSIAYLFLNSFVHIKALLNTITAILLGQNKEGLYELVKKSNNSIALLMSFCLILISIISMTILFLRDQYLLILAALILSRMVIYFSLDFEFHKENDFFNSIKSLHKTSIILKLLFLPINVLGKFFLTKIKNKTGYINKDSIGFTIIIIEIILLNIAIIVS